MEWIKDEDNFDVPIKSWCKDIEDGAMAQAADLAKHPVVFRHVALMPDCHQGYGMPIGGVIACTNAVIPNAVGVDIVYDRWSKVKRGKTKGMYDLSEAPQAYKNIDAVIEAEQDLIKPIVKLRPLGVVKG